MAAKRNQEGEVIGDLDVSHQRTLDVTITESGESARTSIENYPRKRVAVAVGLHTYFRCTSQLTRGSAISVACGKQDVMHQNLRVASARNLGSNAGIAESVGQEQQKSKLIGVNPHLISYWQSSPYMLSEGSQFFFQATVSLMKYGLACANCLSRTNNVVPPTALAQLEKRLAHVESKLRFAVDNGAFPSILSPMSPNDNDLSQQTSLNAIYSPQNQAVTPVNNYTPFVSASFRQTQSEANTARPSFLTFCCPSYVVGESWDDTESFYDDELAAGELLHHQTTASLLLPLDLSEKTTRNLQQSFVQSFLRWFPIFDLNACIRHVEEAFACVFAPTNTSSCITMLMFAIGAIADDSNGDLSTNLPGLGYLARGNQMLEGLSLRTGTITLLQCRILQASYYQFAIRPLQAWNSIVQASRDCMHLLSSSKRRNMNTAERDVLHRVFWSCSIIHQ
jgi:hypothetical protein